MQDFSRAPVFIQYQYFMDPVAGFLKKKKNMETFLPLI